jgi:nucleoside-diphosphate kinase
MEMTFAMIKPNGVTAGLIGRILDRYVSARLSVAGIKLKQMSVADAETFYAEHAGQPYFANLVRIMTSGPSVLLVLAGENAVASARAINGLTNPANAVPGTIRYDFAPSMAENVVHASDCAKSAEREIFFWFQKEEVYSYPAADQKAGTIL